MSESAHISAYDINLIQTKEKELAQELEEVRHILRRIDDLHHKNEPEKQREIEEINKEIRSLIKW